MKNLINGIVLMSLFMSCGKDYHTHITEYIGCIAVDADTISCDGKEYSTEKDLIEYITICEEIERPNAEVIVRLNNQFMAFYQGSDMRLSLLEQDVNYITTDGESLEFVISGNDVICLEE